MDDHKEFLSQFSSTLCKIRKGGVSEKSHVQENVLKLLFCTPEWSANTDLEKVLVKVSTLNDFYSTNIYDTFEVSKAILEIKDFDQKLRNGSWDLVTELSEQWFRRKNRRILSFASKYCANHQPELFPIYDKLASDELWALHKINHFIKDETITNKTKFIEKISEDYSFWAETIKSFQKHYELLNFTFREIDWFLWVKGKERQKTHK